VVDLPHFPGPSAPQIRRGGSTGKWGGSTVNRENGSVSLVTGQLADKPSRGQSSRGLVNSRTSQLAEMFD